MDKIVITTDSGMDPLNEENMVSESIVLNDIESYRDMVEITPAEILEKLNQGNKVKTASPSLSDYAQMFEKYLKEGKDVIHLAMSSGVSAGSVNGAVLIARTLNMEYENKVHVIDTLNGATGGTLINEYAKELTKDHSTKEVVDILQEFKRRIYTSYYHPNPTQFINSGRDSSSSLKEKALVMGVNALNKLKCHYRLGFDEDGRLYTKSMFRGNNKKCVYKLVKDVINQDNKTMYDPKYVVIGNLNEKEVNMEELVNYLKELNYFENIINKSINGVIAAYGCDDLCGISLIKKR